MKTRRGERDVALFGEAMLQKLAENAHKAHWRDEPVQDHLDGIWEEARELEKDVAWLKIATRQADGPRIEELKKKIRREAADVANRALMVCDVLGCLEGRGDAE